MRLIALLPDEYPIRQLVLTYKESTSPPDRISFLYHSLQRMGRHEHEMRAPNSTSMSVVLHAAIRDLVEPAQQDACVKILFGLEDSASSILQTGLSGTKIAWKRGNLLPTLVDVFLKNPELSIEIEQAMSFFDPRPSIHVQAVLRALCNSEFLTLKEIGGKNHAVLTAELRPFANIPIFQTAIKKLRFLKVTHELFGWYGISTSGYPQEIRTVIKQYSREAA